MAEDFKDEPLSEDELKAVGYTDEPIQQQSQSPSTMPGTGLTMEMLRGGFGPAANLAERFGTNPNAAKLASTGANALTTVGGVLKGALSGNATEVLAAPTAGWAAGKGAYWLTKGAQAAARPVASGMDAAKPFTKAALHELAGIQGFLDLAQMAEPNRKDIGTLGVGKTQPNDPEAAAKAEKSTDEYLKTHGYSEKEIDALKAKAKSGTTLNSVADAFVDSIKRSPTTWGVVMNAIQSRMNK